MSNSALVLEVHSTSLDHRSGTSKASGKPWEMFNQKGWIYLSGEPYPKEIQISLERVGDQEPKPLPTGLYEIDLNECAMVGNFGSLELDGRVIAKKMDRKKDLPQKTA